MSERGGRQPGGRLRAVHGGADQRGADTDGAELLRRVARGDEAAFASLYDLLIGPVFGVIRRVVRDPAQSEEVAQEVMVELWRCAARYSPGRGSAMTWAITLAHRRAVDRVRAAQAAADREDRVGRRGVERPFDEVGELLAVPLGTIKTRLRDGLIRLRDCLGVA